MKCREQVSQLRWEHSDSLKELDLATKRILNAIVERQDVFQAAHEAQFELMKIQHKNTMRNIDDTRQEIISARQETVLAVRVIFIPRVYACTYSLLAGTAGHCRTGTVVGQIA